MLITYTRAGSRVQAAPGTAGSPALIGAVPPSLVLSKKDLAPGSPIMSVVDDVANRGQGPGMTGIRRRRRPFRQPRALRRFG